MPPPRSDPEKLHAARSRVAPHDHAVFVYEEDEDLLVPLEHFIEEGARERDLSVFVHSFAANDDARRFLARRVGTLPKHESEGNLTTSGYRDAFERGGRIDHDHAAGVVQMLRDTALRSNRRAPRIFVDASRSYFDAGRVEEWFAFESWLGPRLHAEAGLVCAYRARDLQDPEILRRVLETHEYRFDVPRSSST